MATEMRPPVESQPSPIACLLDAGPAVHQRAGLSRYTERLAVALSQMSGDAPSLYLFYNRHSGHDAPPSLGRLQAYTLPAGQYAWRLSALASQLGRLPYWPIEQVLTDVCRRSGHGLAVYHATEHLLPRLTRPSVLTVHDLIFDQFPEYHTRANRMFLRIGMPLFVRNATRIIAVSQTARRDLEARYGVAKDRIRVVYEGIDGDFAPAKETDIRRVIATYSQGDPYLLVVGSVEPRKNHAAAIQALAILAQAGYPHRLLLAGAKGWMVEPILRYAEQSAVRDRISFLDFVPQADLSALYSAADVFVHPSYYEGFGFGALEAMACGTPVVCSNAGSLPEVTGGAALLVRPQDVAGLAQSIRNVLDQPRLAETLVRKGLDNASRFTWETCARETVAVYHEAARLC